MASLFSTILAGSLRYLRRLAGGNSPASPPRTQRRGTPGTAARGTTARGTAAKGQRRASPPSGVGHYPGDFHGPLAPRYSPALDGRPDPGEIVWTWVPFEEDHTRGKDRPVLLVGHDGPWLLGFMLTSKDHDNGRREDDYVDIGTGPWDPQWRPSEVKLDRVVRVDPERVRREGATLDNATFQTVADRLRRR
ncbi:type II toxin-antitoxin system PemK/MazF family toxin [Arthrobacter celericrescens]|uniref:type II toxin-antitoxin system PemK/MazF family toxin n=1 Tax=Arthrobacter celericrescens TaxID=2320851 RepID=UPI000EA1A90C|nr:type II toxin-antitoxin system PemK/MazF family toxin [Arthrobacter celericrescens]